MPLTEQLEWASEIAYPAATGLTVDIASLRNRKTPSFASVIRLQNMTSKHEVLEEGTGNYNEATF